MSTQKMICLFFKDVKRKQSTAFLLLHLPYELNSASIKWGSRLSVTLYFGGIFKRGICQQKSISDKNAWWYSKIGIVQQRFSANSLEIAYQDSVKVSMNEREPGNVFVLGDRYRLD